MKKLLENTKDFHFMIWETNPNLRKVNNEIKICLKDEVKLNPGDILMGLYGDASASSWIVEEIISQRNATVKGYQYLTIKTAWKRLGFTEIKDYDLFFTSKAFQILLGEELQKTKKVAEK